MSDMPECSEPMQALIADLIDTVVVNSIERRGATDRERDLCDQLKAAIAALEAAVNRNMPPSRGGPRPDHCQTCAMVIAEGFASAVPRSARDATLCAECGP